MAKAPTGTTVIVPPPDGDTDAQEALRAALEAQSETITALNTALTQRTDELSEDIDQCQAELENEILRLTQEAEERANEIQALMLENSNLSKASQAALSTLQSLQDQLTALEAKAATAATTAVIVTPDKDVPKDRTKDGDVVPEKPRRRFL